MPRLALALAAALAVAVALAGCGSGAAAPSAAGSAAPPLTTADLRYALINRFGAPWYCDPDQYPIGRDEQAQAIGRWAEVERDATTLRAIRAHLDLTGAQLTDQQKLAIYREWKRLNAVVLAPVGNDRYRFDLVGMPPPGATEGHRATGLIDARGGIEVDAEAPAAAPNCPICLDGSTLVATPAGPVRVDALTEGSPVWTFDTAGRRIEGVVLAVRSVPAPPTHRLVRLVLDDGRVLLASPGHPLLDGRPLGSIGPGDLVDRARVTSAELVPAGSATWDLLASGPTGAYLADGIALRSTLGP